jgi:hypothetical protein
LLVVVEQEKVQRLMNLVLVVPVDSGPIFLDIL